MLIISSKGITRVSANYSQQVQILMTHPLDHSEVKPNLKM